MRRYYCDSCGKGASRQLTAALKGVVKKAKVAWTFQIEGGVLGRTNPTAVDPEGDRLEHDSYRAAGLGLNSLYVAAGRSRVDGCAAARRGRCGVDAAVPSAWAVYSRHSHSENSIALEYGRLPVSRREVALMVIDHDGDHYQRGTSLLGIFGTYDHNVNIEIFP